MYKLSKLVSLPQSIELPTSMYTMNKLCLLPNDLSDTYYDGICVKKNRSIANEGSDLESCQCNILLKLKELKAKLDKLQENKGLTASTIGAATLANKLKPHGVLHDLVISANPSNPPYSLLLLRKWLNQSRYYVYSQSHIHSSVSYVDPKIDALFNDAPFEKRSLHSVGFTIQWKDVPETTLMVAPLNQSKILGESNIVRYISRLFPAASGYNYEACGGFSYIAEVDFILDDVQTLLSTTKSKDVQNLLEQLNSRLGKSKWLSGNLGMLDAFCWSILLQKGSMCSLPSNVRSWFQMVSEEGGIDKN